MEPAWSASPKAVAPHCRGMMNGRPIDISVVTTTFNRASLLPRAWHSLKGQNPSFEWIIVDDASTDSTAGVVRSFSDSRIVYVRHPENRGGPNAGRNRGSRMARGRYVIFLDDDDELYPGSLSEMVEKMDGADPRVGVALFQCVLAGGGRWDDPIVDGAIYGEKDIVCGNVLGLEKICIYRREIFDSFELPEDLLCSEGVFVFAVAKRYEFLMVARPGRIYHYDSGSVSGPSKIIDRSRQIAMGYERILANHREVLAENPAAESAYVAKALYRYAVASCTSDAMRMFRRLLRDGPAREVFRGAAILLLGLTGMAKLAERCRVAKHLRERFPSV